MKKNFKSTLFTVNRVVLRHAGLDPASSMILCRPEGDSVSDWIPAFAGMTEGVAHPLLVMPDPCLQHAGACLFRHPVEYCVAHPLLVMPGLFRHPVEYCVARRATLCSNDKIGDRFKICPGYIPCYLPLLRRFCTVNICGGFRVGSSCPLNWPVVQCWACTSYIMKQLSIATPEPLFPGKCRSG